MAIKKSLEARFYDHVLGKGCPMQALLNTGVLASDWVDTYLALVREADQQVKNQPCWPRELVAAIHTASWYLNIRYETCAGYEKKRNEKTEQQLGAIRFWSETFLLSPICDLAKTIAEYSARQP